MYSITQIQNKKMIDEKFETGHSEEDRLLGKDGAEMLKARIIVLEPSSSHCFPEGTAYRCLEAQGKTIGIAVRA